MADDNKDSSFERRKFLALLGAAGAYAPPTLIGLLNAQRAFASPASSFSPSSFEGCSFGESSSSSRVSQSSTSSGLSGCGTLVAIADTFIRRDSPNTNEGGNPFIRVGVDPVSRGLVLFDRDALLGSLFPGATVQLVLRIANNHNDWGQYDDRTVSVRPLTESFTGGNGAQSGMPGWQQHRGCGAGATWNSPNDPNVADNRISRASRQWNGGDRCGRRTATPAVHTNQVEGVDVVWDVTRDVLAPGGFPVAGWVIRVDNEPDGDDEHPGSKLPAGFDRGAGGTVEYFSIEGAAAASSPCEFAPRLIIS